MSPVNVLYMLVKEGINVAFHKEKEETSGKGTALKLKPKNSIAWKPAKKAMDTHFRREYCKFYIHLKAHHQ